MLSFSMILFAQNDTTQQNDNQKLLIIIDGIKELKGNLLVGVYNSDSTFMRETKTGFKVKVESESVEIPVEISSGTYAIAVIHDLNDNGKLDTGLFGIPTEKYGFSNNVMGFMGAPSFEKAKFEFPKTKVVRINLK